MPFGARASDDPTLRTTRLVLRPLAYADVPALFEAIDSSRAYLAAWLPWEHDIRSPDDLRVFVDRTLRMNADGEAHRALFEPDGRLAGHASIESAVAAQRSAELGYWVRADRAGRGYATEAVRALLEWGFRHLGLHRVAAFADVANAASRRVLEKTGFREEGVVRHRTRHSDGWRDHVLYGLLEGELTAPRPTEA